jgi:phosphatidate cytidylyltransferase
VSDPFDRNGNDDERRTSAPLEGVRILGAEEAAAVLEHRTHPQDEAPPRPSRFPSDGPSWSSDDDDEDDDDDGLIIEPAAEDPPSGEVPPLPHWTEPPTGVIPAIFAAEDAAEDENDEAWSALAGSSPRFRSEGSDWSGADFEGENTLTDEHAKVGALAEAAVVDEDEAFAADVAERRRRTPRGRAPRTMVTSPPPARPTQQPAAPRRRPAEVEPETTAPPSGRDLPSALMTAGVVAVLALVCFNAGTAWTVVLAAAIMGLATLEFTTALQSRGFRPASTLALVGAVLLPIAAREYGFDAYPIFFGLITIFSMLWFLFEVTPGRPLLGVATSMLAFGYIGGLGGFAGLLLASDDGIGLIFGAVLPVIAYDVFGFFVGSQFGKSPIAKVSPNKTFEGTLAGMVAAVVVGWLIVGQIHPWSAGNGAVLGLFVAVGAFLGDLCESMLKRDLGLKDFGSLLPGHGGVLDRFDAILFALPITFYLAMHLELLT